MKRSTKEYPLLSVGQYPLGMCRLTAVSPIMTSLVAHVICMPELVIHYKWPATGNTEWAELESLGRLTVEVSEIDWSMLGES